MGKETGIEWCHHTFNPWRGCTKVSPGCTHCYAETLSHRNPKVLGMWGSQGTRIVASESYWKQPHRWNREARESGVRRRVFCASLADVFEDREELVGPRADLFSLIFLTPNLDWLLLTKRPENIRRLWPAGYHRADHWIWRNRIWLGTSVENQRYAEERLPELFASPASIRFVSYEPALGPVAWSQWNNAGRWWGKRLGDDLHWIICGGESGPRRRPCDIEWFADTAKQCREDGIACYIKQDMGPKPGMQGRIPDDLWTVKEFPEVSPCGHGS